MFYLALSACEKDISNSSPPCPFVQWKPYFGLDDASFSPDDDDGNDGNKGDSGDKEAGHSKVKRRRVRRKRRKTSNGTTGEPGGDGNGGGDGGAQPEMSSEDEDDDHIPEERMNNIQLTMTNFQIIDKLAEKVWHSLFVL